MTREEQMKFHELQALWWIASATTGHCKSRKIYKGFGDQEFTDEEKVADAMETSKSHIDLFWKLVNNENTENTDFED